MNSDIAGFVVIVEESEKVYASQDICIPCDGGWIRLRTKPAPAKKEKADEE